MARRIKERTKKRMRVTLANGETAVRGYRAHANSADGAVYADPASIGTLFALGYFEEDMEGDGTQKVWVELFEEVKLDGWMNDVAPNAIDESDLFSEVYFLNGTTVSTDSDTDARSVAGRVFEVEGNVVYLLNGFR